MSQKDLKVTLLFLKLEKFRWLDLNIFSMASLCVEKASEFSVLSEEEIISMANSNSNEPKRQWIERQ